MSRRGGLVQELLKYRAVLPKLPDDVSQQIRSECVSSSTVVFDAQFITKPDLFILRLIFPSESWLQDKADTPRYAVGGTIEGFVEEYFECEGAVNLGYEYANSKGLHWDMRLRKPVSMVTHEISVQTDMMRKLQPDITCLFLFQRCVIKYINRIGGTIIDRDVDRNDAYVEITWTLSEKCASHVLSS